MANHSLSIGGVHFGKADIQSSNAIIDERGLPVVAIEFTPTGQEKFQRAMHRTGVGRPMSVRVDKKEVTAPVLQDLDIKDRVTLAGLSSLKEATTIAAAITSATGQEDQ